MMVFEIKTTKSDYPFLVLADDFSDLGILLREKNVFDYEVFSVRKLDAYKNDHILVKDLILTEERLEKKVRRELAPKLPHWKKIPDGIAGGDSDRILIRFSRGQYIVSSCIVGDGYYLDMDDLEQLPGLPYNEV